MANDSILLSLKGISKSFPGAHALKNIDMEIHSGETHILLGENGAGKSTLVKILTGVYPPDNGQIIYKANPIQFNSPADSQKAGIRAIYQERNLVQDLSIAENIYLGDEPHIIPVLPIIDRKKMVQGTQDLLDRLNLPLDPMMPVKELNAVEQQMIEVARALRLTADLIIMDEPTASMSPRDVTNLFGTIRALHAQGVSVLYISHRLEEVLQIGDRATVLRNGKLIATVPLPDTSMDQLIRLIVGRPITEKFPGNHQKTNHEVLRVEGLSREGSIDNISFSLNQGEILGIAGLVGAGGTALTRSLFGANPIDSGRIILDGKEIKIGSPQDAIGHGIGLLTDDRLSQGLVLNMRAQDNVTLAALENAWPGPFIDHQLENNLATLYAERLGIQPEKLQETTLHLSGGTQQKIVLSKWLATKARVLIFDEPTRGIDIGARVELYGLINELARNGSAIIITSVDINEILGMCDRILVLHHGKVTADLHREEATKEKILLYASGSGP